MVGNVIDLQGGAKLVVFQPGGKRQVKILAEFQIKRNKCREALVIDHPNIVLQNVEIGIRETSVDVEQRCGGDVPGNLEAAPCDHSVGHIGGQSAVHVGAYHRCLKWDVDLPERI